MDVLIFVLQIIAVLAILAGIMLMEDVGMQIASFGAIALGGLLFVESRRAR